MGYSRLRVGIINSPVYSITERIVLDNHIRTLQPVCEEILVIAGNFPYRYGDQVRITEIQVGRDRPKRPHALRRFIDYARVQFALTYRLARILRRVDVVFFDVGEYRNLLPVFVSIVFCKRVVVFHRGGNKLLEAQLEEGQARLERLIPFIQEAMLRLCYRLAHYILCEAESIVKFGQLERYRSKIVIFGPTFVDTEHFSIKLPYGQRGNLVGHFGRLTPKKRTMNLVRAVPIVLSKRDDVEFLIAGDGPERDRIEQEIERLGLGRWVTLRPLIAHEELPTHLNQLKLLVIPSDDEGVPTTMMEAMACGVVVLATPVGGIPDVVRDGETGFILSDSSPESIAQGILRSLAYPGLAQIAVRGRDLIETERSLGASTAKWKEMLEKVTQRDRDRRHVPVG